MADLKVNGTTVTGFNAETIVYNVELAAGTTAVPVVTATVNEEHATAEVNAASVLPGSTTVVVTAEDGSNKTYTVNFTVAEPEPSTDVTTLFSAKISSAPGAAVSVPKESSVNLSAYAEVTGGSIIFYNKRTDKAQDVIAACSTNMSVGSSKNYFEIQLNSALAEGDIISFTTPDNHELTINTSSSSSGNGITTSSQQYTVTGSDVLNGKTAIYVWRYVGSGSTNFNNFTISRGGMPAPPKSSVCTLSDLKSGGATVEGFSAETLEYNIELAEGTTSVPVVVATCTDSKASAAVAYGTINNNQATTTVTVTAEDGSQKVYTINYTVAETVVVTTYNVVAEAGNGGVASVSPSGEVVSGSEVVFTATPSSGYTFANWTDGSTVVSTSATYNTPVTSDITLTANFTKQSDTSGRSWDIDGFAAYEGEAGTAHYHADGTTGGAGGKVVKATNFTELQAYLQSNDPYIILVDRDITTGVTAYVDDLSTGHLYDSQDGSEGVATTYGERIMVQSNKTLIGIADANGNAPLISRITFNLQCAHNVIIRNCRFTMNSVPIMKSGENKIVAMRDGVQTEVGDPDCIGIQADKTSASSDSGSHIWIDHCELFNGNATNIDRYDGLVDIKNNVQWITLSYNRFHDHYKACLFGKGDSDNYDRTITMHHNVFENIVGSRLPLQRYGHLHYVNNYMLNASDGYDLRTGSIGYIESCYFKDSKAPVRLRGEGSTNIRTDKEYSIVYDNCLRIINNNPNFTYLNQSKVDEEYSWAPGGANSNSWVPTQTWSGYQVNNIDPVMSVPEVCEQYSGAGKVVLWYDYTNQIPAEDMEEVKAAVLNSSYNTYNVDGTKFVPTEGESDDYDVKFYSQGAQVGATQSVESGSYAIAPADPERDNYTFGGWSIDGGNTAVNVATYAITQATNFYAIWNEIVPDAPETELVLVDGQNYTATEDKTYADGVTYTRNFSTSLVNKWTSFYVPFAVNVEDYLTQFDIAEIFAMCPVFDTNHDGDVTAEDEDYLILMKKTSGTTQPNKPYLIRAKADGTCEIAAVDGNVYAATNGTVSCYTTAKTYTFTGVYSPVTANPENGYWYMSGGSLSHKTSGSANISSNRWYMEVSDREEYGSAPSIQNSINIAVIGEDIDNATAVNAIKQSKGQLTDRIYNLGGVQVDANYRGISIREGKAYINK